MSRKAKLTTKEVAWTSGEPTLYQSALECRVSNNRIIRISGDPLPTTDEAEESLYSEFHLWEMAMLAFKEAIREL